MRSWESPARAAEAEKSPKEGKECEEAGAESRPMASGAVARIRRRRQKEWKRDRGRESGSASDGEDVPVRLSYDS